MEKLFTQGVPETTVPPLRKRRRPALSCVECRRRKIKCDRNDPCNHCKQSKGSACIYKDVHPPIANRRPSTTNKVVPTVGIQEKASPRQECPRQDFNINFTTALNGEAYGYSSVDTTPYTGAALTSEGSSPSREWDTTTVSTVDSFSLREHTPGLVDRRRRVEPGLPSHEERESTVALGLNFSTFGDITISDGIGNARLRTKYFKSDETQPIKELKGMISKARFFGNGHWMHTFAQFREITALKDKMFTAPTNTAVNEDIRNLLEKCKTMARKVKSERPIQWHMNPTLADYVPARDLADKLVQHYLRAMESTHRILHIPSFMREYEGYWSDPQKAPGHSVVKILLVLAIGTCFYQEEGNESLRAMAQQWVYSAQSWVCAPFEKGRLNISGLQVHCLLLLARQTNAVGGDLLWIGNGSLLRTAFQMGFHRDPRYFPKMSIMHGELRRRLWATVLDMTIQASLDAGLPPLIRHADFDTELPSNLNDEDFSEETVEVPTPKPNNVFTQTSIQIQLMKSLPTRLSISLLINDFHAEPSYEEVITLGAELTTQIKQATLLFNSLSSPNRPSAMHRNLLDMFMRRFLFGIHCSYSLKSLTHPQYYFSRKVSLDTALALLSYTCDAPPVPGTMDDFTRLRSVGGGFYKEVAMNAVMVVCLELILQLEDELSSGFPMSLSSQAHLPLQQVVQSVIDLSAKRIELGENNVKCHLFICAAMGQIKAMEEGRSPQEGIVEVAKTAARHCLDLLKARTKTPETPETPAEVAPVLDPAMGSMDQDFTWGADFVMGEGSPGFNLEMPDAWAFSGWDETSSW